VSGDALEAGSGDLFDRELRAEIFGLNKKMEDEVRTALFNQNYVLAQELCDEWLKRTPLAAVANYLAAWSRDAQGLEPEALLFYEKALALGLTGSDLRRALLGTASTYRNVGELARSEELLRQGIREYGAGSEFTAFLALTLYSAGRFKEAISSLLGLLVDTTEDQHIKRYERALRYYADDLDGK
jgi:tetratricopeptide (TPR) repeat protein